MPYALYRLKFVLVTRKQFCSCFPRRSMLSVVEGMGTGGTGVRCVGLLFYIFLEKFKIYDKIYIICNLQLHKYNLLALCVLYLVLDCLLCKELCDKCLFENASSVFSVEELVETVGL